MKQKANLHLFLTAIVSESRLYKEASYLRHHGIFDQVFVLGMWENGLNFRSTHESGLEIIRCRSTLRRLRAAGLLAKPSIVRTILAIWAYVEYMIAALRVSRDVRPSHISVHNLILLPIAVFVAKMYGARMVYVPHELETERTGLVGLQKRLSSMIEKCLIRFATNVVVVCEPIAEWYRNTYRLSNVYTIRNVPRKADVGVVRDVSCNLKSLHKVPENSILFIYQGLIEQSRGPDELVRAFEGSKNSLIFMGYGGYVENLKRLKFENIHFQPAVPIEKIISFTASADVGLFVVGSALSLSYQWCLPNKFFEYLHAGLPVIVSRNLTYLSELVTNAGIGWVIEHDSLRNVIETITREELLSMKSRVLEYATGCVWENDAQAYKSIYA